MDVGKYTVLFKNFLWRYGLIQHMLSPINFRYDDGEQGVYGLVSDMANQIRYETVDMFVLGQETPEQVKVKEIRIDPSDIFEVLITNERYNHFSGRLRGLGFSFSQLDTEWRRIVANEGDIVEKPNYKSIW
jgi:hypothetical protein